MKKLLIVIFIILLAGTVGYAALVFSHPNQKNEVAEISIRGHAFSAEIVKSAEKITLGLGSRKSMCASCGMLFIFPQLGTYSFWMKGMEFPLDIIWIKENKVVYIVKNISQSDQSIFRPSAEADKVLEINAGLSNQYSFGVGDEVSF